MATSHPSSTWTSYLRTSGRLTPADPEAFAHYMRHERFPAASEYDPRWVHLNQMGPNALWLVDGLCQRLSLEPGMKVLDLGCGSAITSIFMAREFGVRVHAADLWIEPWRNLPRIQEAEVDHLVVPIEAEAHALPFGHAYFDVVVSVDSYHYFGTDVRYLSYLAQFVRPGGAIAVMIPGNATDPDDRPDDRLGPESARHGADWFTFRSAGWWHRHWSRTTGVQVEVAEMVPDGWDLWWRHVKAGAAWSGVAPEESDDAGLLLAPEGRTLGFALVIARRTDEQTLVFGPGRFTTRVA